MKQMETQALDRMKPLVGKPRVESRESDFCFVPGGLMGHRGGGSVLPFLSERLRPWGSELISYGAGCRRETVTVP